MFHVNNVCSICVDCASLLPVLLYVYTHTCVCVYIDIYGVCMYVGMYVCRYVGMYVSMYKYMYVCIVYIYVCMYVRVYRIHTYVLYTESSVHVCDYTDIR